MTDLQETYEKYLSVCKINKKELHKMIVLAMESGIFIVDPRKRLIFD